MARDLDHRIRMLTPGPVGVPESVMKAIAQPVIPHRSPAFQSFYGDLLENMRYLFQTDGKVCGIGGPGSMAMRLLLSDLLNAGDKVFTPVYGKFSARWADYAAQLGLDHISPEFDWQKGPSTNELIEAVEKHPDLKAVVLTHCETSTGVVLDLESLAWKIREVQPDCLIIVDAISTIGSIPFYMDAWGLDAAVVSSPKALQNPSGTAFIAVSDRAYSYLDPLRRGDPGNLRNYFEFAEKGLFPFTAPVQLLYGIAASLDHIKAEGLPVIWNRTHQLAVHFRKELEKIGGSVWTKNAGSVLTAFYFSGFDLDLLKEKLEKEYQVIVSGGQDQLNGQILRVGHFGPVTLDEMSYLARSLESLTQ